MPDQARTSVTTNIPTTLTIVNNPLRGTNPNLSGGGKRNE